MSRSAEKNIFFGTFVFSQNLNKLEYLKDTAVCIDGGVIVAIEKNISEKSQTKQIIVNRLGWENEEVGFKESMQGQFFFPGFIDTHFHAPQFANSGIFGRTTLMDWLATYTFPTEASMVNLAKAKQVFTRCVQRTLSHGTTTAAYYATLHVDTTNILAETCFAKGQRAFIGRVCMDSSVNPAYYRDISAESCLTDTRATISHIASIDPTNLLITPVITPRFAPSCTSQAMRYLSALQRETGLPVQTHISENKSEIDLVRQLFPHCVSYADVYDQHGLLCPTTILAHAVHLSEEEADLIKDRRSKISHCPVSNSALGSGRAKIRWLLRKGIDVGLGSDVSGGYSASILETARQSILVSRHLAMDGDEEAILSVEEVLYLATRGGAKILGLEEKTGAFKIGMMWDAQLIGLNLVCDDVDALSEEGGVVDVFPWQEDEECISKWLFNGDDRNTLAVWVQGRLVHERKIF